MDVEHNEVCLKCLNIVVVEKSMKRQLDKAYEKGFEDCEKIFKAINKNTDNFNKLINKLRRLR